MSSMPCNYFPEFSYMIQNHPNDLGRFCAGRLVKCLNIIIYVQAYSDLDILDIKSIDRCTRKNEALEDHPYSGK